MVNTFVWFVFMLLVTVSNIVFSAVVYRFLSVSKKHHKGLDTLKNIALFYAICMTAGLIFAALLSTFV